MDFELPHEIRLLQDTVRKFVDRELIPIEMQSMDGPDLKPDIRKHSKQRPASLDCGCSRCRQSWAGRI